MTARLPTMVTLHDTRFVECRWWNDGWTVKTVIPALGVKFQQLATTDMPGCGSFLYFFTVHRLEVAVSGDRA